MSSASGRAARPTSLPRGISPGGLGARVVAYLIDSVVGVIVAAGATAAVLLGSATLKIVGSAAAALIWVGWLVFLWYRLALKGATPGMAVTRLELIAHRTGKPLGWGKVLLRGLIFGVLSGTGIGWVILVVTLLVDPLHQGLHDRAISAVLIGARPKTPRSAPPTSAMADRPRPSGNMVGLPSHLTGAGGASFGQPLPPPSNNLQPQQQPAGLPWQQPGPDDPFAPRNDQAAGQRWAPPDVMPHGASSGPDQRGQQGRPQHQVSADRSPLEAGESTRLVPKRGGLPQRPPDQGWVIALDDGRQVSLTGLVLLGRAPAPRPGEQVAELIAVSDNSRTVSKTHIAVGVDSKGVFIMDRGSTNGSAIATPTGKYEPCAAGDLVRVREGQIISFGDHRMEIRRTY